MPWVTKGITAVQADAGAERIGGDTKDVNRMPVTISPGHCLHGGCTRREDEVVLTVGDLGRDGVADRHVARGVVLVDHGRTAVAKSRLFECLHHPGYAVVQYGTICVLQDGNSRDLARFGIAPVHVGQDQNGRGERDQRDAEREALQGGPHSSDLIPGCD